MSDRKSAARVPLVLIVDDDFTTALTLQGLLQGAGLATLLRGSLAEADALFHAQPIALVLLDVHLPDGYGLDLCRKLTAVSPVPILFISGDGDVATKTGGFAAGGVDYITKPLAGAEVLARVRTHLRLSAARESLAALHAERIARLSTAQQSLMARPEDLPQARFAVSIRQVLQAGGDFYDVIPVGDRIVDYVVADASGHDLGVSLWTASFKTLLAEYISAVDAPLDTCRAINDSLRRVLPDGAYFTVLYARLERGAKRLTLVYAGHPPAILVSGRGGEGRLLEQDGDLLGIFADAAFGVMTVPVQAGDRLYLYTDGLIEMHGSREDGCERALAACRQAAGLPLQDAVMTVVDTICGGLEPQDDIILLGMDV
jgi:sigma-B regulation protein RsbU (phosphoserine phosphatase)